MNLIRTAFSTPIRLFLFPPCTIDIQRHSTTANYISKYADSLYSAWRDLVKNPTDWCDYREDKLVGLVKAKHPDFKHKTNGTSLWLNSAPNSVLALLDKLNVAKKEDSWKNLVQNPDKWWDCRLKKVSETSPDFVLKETGEGLWLDSSPKWVLQRLEGLKAAKGKREDGWKNLVENPDKWWDNRPTKINLKEPDFKHKETGVSLWLDSAPQWVVARAERLNLGNRKKEDSWKDLVENPDKWLDNRPRKTNVNMPDFRNKETNEGLWINSCPKWVLSQLPC